MSPLAADGRRRSEHRGRDEREPDGRVASARKVNEKDLDAKKRETRQVDVERNSAGKVQGDVIAVLRSAGDTFDLVSRCV